MAELEDRAEAAWPSVHPEDRGLYSARWWKRGFIAGVESERGAGTARTVEALRESIQIHSPNFLRAAEAPTDVIVMMVTGFRTEAEKVYLWECLTYAALVGKQIHLGAEPDEDASND